MAVHILCVGSEFPEALEEFPAESFTLSEKKSYTPSFVKKIKLLPGLLPEEMTQEEVVEYPDFLALAFKNRAAVQPFVVISFDLKIPFKEVKHFPFHPDGHLPPPKHS